jgi:hypothetical protein
VRTIQEVAVWARVDPRTVRAWITAGMPPREDCGRFDLLKIKEWYETPGRGRIHPKRWRPGRCRFS